MSAKKLDQSVFEGLPKEYRWAAVSRHRGGSAHVFPAEPISQVEFGDWTFFSDRRSICVGSDYDATDWQNSKIERQDVPTADIDWSAAPQGATHAIYEHDFVLWLQQQPSGSWLGQTALGDVWDKLSGEPEGFVFERPKTQVDWSKAPEGATHYAIETSGLRWLKADGGDFWKFWGDDAWKTSPLPAAIPRPESITDVARSIEAARVEEQKFKVKPCPHGCVAATIEQACMPWPDGDARYFDTSDAVNNPAHYTTGGIECIDAMQAMLSREEFIGYLRGNIFKYQWRYKHKNGVEDLRKADWYAQRLIRVEGEK